MIASKKAKRILAFFLCLLVCLVTLFSLSFIVLHADHDCTGENCPVCAEIGCVFSTLKTISEAIACAVIITGAVWLVCFSRVSRYTVFRQAQTAVTQKVQLNN